MMLKCLLLFLFFVWATSLEEIDLPPILDSDDIAYFFARNDLATLHWALKSVFDRGERNLGGTALPPKLVARGGGLTYTSAYKLHHDIEQAEYLAENLEDAETATFFRDVVLPAYRSIQVPLLEDLTRTQGLYSFTTKDRKRSNSLYNKALYHPVINLVDGHGTPIPLLNPKLDVNRIEKEWKGGEHPGIVAVDDILSKEAVAMIQQVLWEATVWYETKLPLTFGGYVGAYIDDGLHDRIFLDLAMAISNALPNILRDHPLKYLWAYKYDSEYTGINLHADQAAVNVNLWLTPDDANLDPDSGGLVVFTAKPPTDWEFAQYNTDTDFVNENLLQPTHFANVTIPYRLNRAVIFDSALFHQTDRFRFKKGYKNRRINLTLLYGDMQPCSSKQSTENESANDEL
jgi:hypothetical protein